MKHKSIIFTAMLCFGMSSSLFGCTNQVELSIYGEVVDLIAADGGQVIIIEGDSESASAILVNSETTLNGMRDIELEDLTSGAYITARDIDTVESGYDYDGEELELYSAQRIELTMWRDSSLSLLNGTAVDVWRYRNRKIYMLPDKTELLVEEDCYGPDESVGQLTSVDAEEAILKFYAERGLQYDIMTELEAAYQSVMQGSAEGHIAQVTMLSAYSDDIVYFSTEITLPAYEIDRDVPYLCDGFDRVSGEHIGMNELWNCDEETLVAAILDSAQVTDSERRGQFEENFEYRYIQIYGDLIQVTYPIGVISDIGTSSLVADIDDMRPLMHDWAVPKNE